MYGIECSAIADQAKQIVEDNGYSKKVTILKAKVEEVGEGGGRSTVDAGDVGGAAIWRMRVMGGGPLYGGCR